MEAIFFRFLAGELTLALVGSRVEKVYLPAPNYLTLSLHPARPLVLAGEPLKHPFLHVRYGTGRFFCFLSGLKTMQPERAPAEAMRLRKHLRGRRIVRVLADWPRRRLLLGLTGPGPGLVLDPRAFPALTEIPEAAPEAPDWPALEAVLTEPDIWQAHAQCSPELRRRLAALPRETAQAVYTQLTAGEPDGFFVESKRDLPEAVWPVAWPEAITRGREVRRFDTALAAAAAFGEPLAFTEVSGRRDAPHVAAEAAGRRRLARALAKLEADEARMRGFIARRATADLLAAQLHGLDARARLPRVVVSPPDADPVTIDLDPSLTVVQNMQKLYHLVAKGERGLVAIAARRQGLQDGKKALQGQGRRVEPPRPGRTVQEKKPAVAAHRYRTSDGFLALRGRNAKANEQLLRQANAFDFWLHVADGPGAHVILRRDHPGREVPRRSLAEAAGLAVLASYAVGAGAADVLVALVADVRRVKGAAAGRVSVSTVLETVRAVPDPGLENLRETP